MSQLNGLFQSIHAGEDNDPPFILVSKVTASPQPWILGLYGTDADRIKMYNWYAYEVLPTGKKEKAAVQAIKDGLLHLELPEDRAMLAKSETLKLHILPEGSGEDPIVITLRQSTSLSTAEALLQAFAFRLRIPDASVKPSSSYNKSRIGGNDVSPNGFESTDEVSELRREVQALKSTLAEKEAVINTYHSKVSAMEGKLARVSPKKPKVAEVERKAPAGASKLQPNQKRRKIVEDEFAGESDDDDDDE